jgi:hypothetical protein
MKRCLNAGSESSRAVLPAVSRSRSQHRRASDRDHRTSTLKSAFELATKDPRPDRCRKAQEVASATSTNDGNHDHNATAHCWSLQTGPLVLTLLLSSDHTQGNMILYMLAARNCMTRGAILEQVQTIISQPGQRKPYFPLYSSQICIIIFSLHSRPLTSVETGADDNTTSKQPVISSGFCCVAMSID